MRIIALCVLRNEEWILGASLRAAMRWCDGAAIFFDRCTDYTVEIVKEIAKSSDKDFITSENVDGEHWDEMDHRQKNLEDARSLGATHCSITDADEILTHNNLGNVRNWFGALKDGEVLDVPMIAPWKSLDWYSPHTRGIITLGFKDAPGLGFAPRGEEKYHHHNRPPHCGIRTPVVDAAGGVMHLQFAAWNRFIWKHRHYMMSELVRWSYPASEITEKYHWALKPPHGNDLLKIPESWWGDYPKSKINLNAPVWYERECKRMVREYGAERFKDLDLFGWRP